MRTPRLLCSILLVVILGGCGGASSPATETQPIVIGFTASQTGSYSAESKEQVQGLQLWADEVNARGGFQAGPNTIQVVLKSYDDESNKDQVTALYTKLAVEDQVDFLISPYSSGLAAAAAVVAEQNGRLLIAVGAASDGTFSQGYQHTFQIYTPASRYLAGAVDMLRSTDSAAGRIAILYENEKFATDVATFAREYAQRQGLEVVMFETYEPGTTDFSPWIETLTAAAPAALLGGGHYADGAALAAQLAEKRVPMKLVSLLVAPAVPEFSELGSAALHITGPSQWEPQVQYSPAGAQALGIPFYGPGVAEFAQAYESRYGYAPGYHAAGGYAAGLVLQRAIEEAGSTTMGPVEKALEKMAILTLFGRIQFDTGTLHGLQIGHEMVYLQWQRNSSGEVVKQVVWPEAGRSAPLKYPRQVP